jgi:hypothetical protein
MFCVHCGAYLQSASAPCSVCGKATRAISGDAADSGTAVAAATGPATLQPGSKQVFDPEVQRLRTEHPELVGVRGWLAWFYIITAIVSPVIVLLSTIAEPSPYSIIDLGLAGFSVVTGVAIWRLWPRALTLTKVLLGIQFAIGALIVLGQIVETSTSGASSSSSSPDATGARALVGSIIWFSYFKKSRRVKATFGRNI